MKIYISSSWKNEHAVELLTGILRTRGHEVLSFVENDTNDGKMVFEDWAESSGGQRAFEYDTQSVINCDIVIYLSPSGSDSWALVGAAWGAGVPVLGLWAKGEGIGLMRKMVRCWYPRYRDLLQAVESWDLVGGRKT